MPYYQGDFYRNPRGDFYRGDPGFFSFLSGIGKSLVGAIPGVGPAIAGLIPSGERAIVKSAGAPAAAGLAKRLGGAGMRAIKGHPVLSAAGAAGLVGGVGALAGAKLEKHLMRGKKHRRMRVTNPRALRRAIRRATGFTKLAMRTIHLIHPRKKARFGGFRKKRRA